MIEITIPKLGLTMERAVITKWPFKSGDQVKKDDIILIIETDKVSFEVPSPADGILHPVAKPGEILNVGDIAGYLSETRAEYEKIIEQYPLGTIAETDKVEAVDMADTPVPGEPPSLPPVHARGKRMKASPLARSMAGKHGLDLTAVKGSGPGGRIVRADILRAMEERKRIGRPDTVPFAGLGKELLESIPIQGVRRVISDNMFMSLSQSAQLTLHTEASAEALIRLREMPKKEGLTISYNAIFVKISAMALRLHPRINASVEGDMIRIWKQIHIGLAMESNDALIVPVMRNPDLKTIRSIDKEITELIEKTRENRLSPDDLTNGTFTISNLGYEDIDHFTPIIRPPESAILGIGRIVRKPVVRDNRIEPEARIGLSLTFDHRIIDGAPAARFLKTIKDMVEEPALMVL